jgi:hypothetical protein
MIAASLDDDKDWHALDWTLCCDPMTGALCESCMARDCHALVQSAQEAAVKEIMNTQPLNLKTHFLTTDTPPPR